MQIGSLNDALPQDGKSYKALNRTFIKTATPMVSARAIAFATDFLISLYLSRQSRTFLHASSLISSAQNMVITVPRVALGPISRFSRMALGKAATNHESKTEVGEIFKRGQIYALMLSLAVTPITLLANPIFKTILDQDTEISDASGDFFWGLGVGLPANFALNVIQSLFFGVNQQQQVLYTTTLNSALTLGLTYLFSEQLGWGIKGAGYAYSAAATLTLGVSLLILKRPEFAEYQIFEPFKKRDIDWKKLCELISFGSNTALQVGSELASTIGVALLANTLDINSKSSTGIVLQCLKFTQVPLIASAVVVIGLIAQNYHTKPKDAYRYGQIALGLTLAYSTITAGLFTAIPRQLGSIFIGEDTHTGAEKDAILDKMSIPFACAAIGMFFDTIKNICDGSLQGYGRNKLATTFSIIMALGIVGFGAIANFELNMGEDGILGARSLAMILTSIAFLLGWNKEAQSHLPKPPRDHSHSIVSMPELYSDTHPLKQHLLADHADASQSALSPTDA